VNNWQLFTNIFWIILTVPQNLFGFDLGEAAKTIGRIGSEVVSALSDAFTTLQWNNVIDELLKLITTTLTKMAEIALQDNPGVGAEIQTILKRIIAKAEKVVDDYKASADQRRRKRSSATARNTVNELGSLLVCAKQAIAGLTPQLSQRAQKEINEVHEKAVKECKADTCSSAAAGINAVKCAASQYVD